MKLGMWEPPVDRFEHADKQRHLQRILDRVQELPVLPGHALEPRPAPAALFRPTARTRAPAARFWLLALTSATATIVVGLVACVVTLKLMQQRPSERVEQVSLNHTHEGDAPIAAPPATRLPPLAGPVQEKVAPAAKPAAEPHIEPPPALETATPRAELGSAEDPTPVETRPPAAKQPPRAPLVQEAEPDNPAPDIRKPPPERRRTLRAAVAQPEQTQVIEPNGRSRTVGVADVLSGGL